MPLKQQKIKLKKAVNASPNLSRELKDRLLKQMDSFSPDEAGKLEEALKIEHTRMNRVEEEYKESERRLKVDYLKVLGEFNNRGMQKAFREWESLNLKDRQKAEHIINNLKEEQAAEKSADAVKEEKAIIDRKSGKANRLKIMNRLMWAGLAAAAVICYYIFYKP